MPGILRVAVLPGELPGDQRITVCVSSLESEAAEQVFELEAKLFREHPSARLDVAVKGLEERGLSPAAIDSLLPAGARVLR